MFALFLFAFSLTFGLLHANLKGPVVLKALPAYLPQKRLPKGRKNPIPDYIPNFYY